MVRQVARSTSDLGEPLAGRCYELELLGAALADVRRGGPRLMLVEGPGGIGKTALVRQFCRSAPLQTNVWTLSDPAESRLAWVVVRRLAHRSAAMSHGGVDALEAVLEPPADPGEVGRALLALIRSEAPKGEPTIVVVDDGQWMDPPSASALRLGFERCERDQVLLVVIVRTTAPQETANAWHRLVASDPRAERLCLGGLGVAELRELALDRGRILGLAGARRLATFTSGSPLWAGALVEELDPGVLDDGAGPIPAPRLFASEVSSRIEACSTGTLALLGAVSVLGSPVVLEDAAALAGIDDPLVALEEAAAVGLLVESQGAARALARFHDQMTESAVYYGMGPARRRRLHTSAVDLTVGEDRLRHRVAAVRGLRTQSQALAEELRGLADDEAGNGMMELAALHLRQAASCCADRELRRQYLLRAGRALLCVGDVTGAQAALDEAARIGAAGDAWTLGNLALHGGRAFEARRLLEHAGPVIPDSRGSEVGTPGVGEISSVGIFPHRARGLSVLSLFQGNPQEIDRRSAGFGCDVDFAMVDEGSFASLLAPAMMGGTANALKAVSDQIDESGCSPGALMGRAVMRLWTDDTMGARDDLKLVLGSTVGRSEHLFLASHALSVLADVNYRSGAWDDSARDAGLAAELSESAGRPWHAAIAHAIAAHPMASRGDWASAEAHVQAAERLASQAPVALVTACAARARATLAYARRDFDTAIQAMEAAEAAFSIGEPGFFCDGDIRAAALLAIGRVEAAEEAVSPLALAAQASGRRSAQAQVARVRGGIAAARGDLERAVEHFSEGVHHLEGLSMPFEEARLHLRAGQAMARSGQAQTARRAFELARDLLVGLCARPLLAVCAREMGALPGSAMRTPAWLSLTPAERRVAEAAGKGMRNAEIAEQLFVSIKTVETHLYRVFSKLGISRRFELTAQPLGVDGPSDSG